MAYTTRKTVNRLAHKQLHLNHVVPPPIYTPVTQATWTTTSNRLLRLNLIDKSQFSGLIQQYNEICPVRRVLVKQEPRPSRRSTSLGMSRVARAKEEYCARVSLESLARVSHESPREFSHKNQRSIMLFLSMI